MGASQRRKGHGWERYVARILSAIFPEARRGLSQSRGGGAETADVEVPHYHIECKRGRRVNLRAALRQAIDDHDGSKMPVAIARDDHAAPIVVMLLKDWILIIDELESRRRNESGDC